MLGRRHVSFRGHGHDPRQLVEHVEDAVASDFTAPIFHLVQYSLLQVVQGQFQPYSGSVRGVAAFHIVAMYRVLRVVVLADGDDPSLMVVNNFHVEVLRNFCTTSRPLQVLFALILNTHLVPTNLCLAGTHVIGTRLKRS